MSTDPSASLARVNIRPGVSILSVLRHLNYRPWYALGEFVDNSLQSFLSHREQLEDLEGPDFRLKVSIELDPSDGGCLTIRDNAAGILESEFPRAFRPAEIPPDRTGMAEFGMGMKSAACWFAKKWSVRTSACGEAVERTVRFDIEKIVSDRIEELEITRRPSGVGTHFTEIRLEDLNRLPVGRTLGKIKEHLTSIYRNFLRSGVLRLEFDGDVLAFKEVPVLFAPYYKNPTGKALSWRKEIDFDFGLGLRATGFAAIRETASTSEAGFALFRRDRLIEGSVDEGYRPEVIFGKSNSFRFQRVFGELQLHGFDVTHTKDGFQWNDYEDVFLELLKERLAAEPLPLLDQADEHRVRNKSADIKPGAEAASKRTAETIEREVPPVVEHQLDSVPTVENPPPILAQAPSMAARREISVKIREVQWQIVIELSTDPSVSDWLSMSDKQIPGAVGAEQTRRLVVRLALAHPFMDRFGGTDPDRIEPLLRVAVAIALAETTARASGVRQAGTIRRNVNEFLGDALSKP